MKKMITFFSRKKSARTNVDPSNQSNADTENDNQLIKLPNEILLLILSIYVFTNHFTPNSLLPLRLSCKRLHDLVSDPKLWRPLVIRSLPQYYLERHLALMNILQAQLLKISGLLADHHNLTSLQIVLRGNDRLKLAFYNDHKQYRNARRRRNEHEEGFMNDVDNNITVDHIGTNMKSFAFKLYNISGNGETPFYLRNASVVILFAETIDEALEAARRQKEVSAMADKEPFVFMLTSKLLATELNALRKTSFVPIPKFLLMTLDEKSPQKIFTDMIKVIKGVRKITLEREVAKMPKPVRPR